VFVASFKKNSRLFSERRIEKEPLQQTEAPFVHRKETCSDMTVYVFRFQFLCKLNQCWSRASFFILHLLW